MNVIIRHRHGTRKDAIMEYKAKLQELRADVSTLRALYGEVLSQRDALIEKNVCLEFWLMLTSSAIIVLLVAFVACSKNLRWY